jgi:hypothetical protein
MEHKLEQPERTPRPKDPIKLMLGVIQEQDVLEDPKLQEACVRMAQAGFTRQEIAELIGISPQTLYTELKKNETFRELMNAKNAEADGKVVRVLYKMALSGFCPQATIKWIDFRMNYIQKVKMEHSVNSGYDASILSRVKENGRT